MGWWQIHPHYHAKLSLLNKLVMSSMSSLHSSAPASAQLPLFPLLLPQYLPVSKGHLGELVTQCLQSTLRSPRWKVVYNPLLDCPDCISHREKPAVLDLEGFLVALEVPMCHVLKCWGVGQPCTCWWEWGQTSPMLQDAPVLAHGAASSLCHHE